MAGHFGGNPFKWDYPAGPNNPHIARYFLARGFIMPWETVLDAACAQGYGSKIIALAAKKVYGYEVDEGCIADAKLDNPENCEFKVMDLDTCELPDVDVAVVFETIEHLNDMYHFTEQLRKHVKRCIIVSVPIGGTSYAYVNEPPGPATEKNDFADDGAIQKVVMGDKDDWKILTQFRYGYSHFGIYFKDQIEVPKEWEKRIGWAEGQYVKAK
jgi:SAM-dependent methyltransferase